MSDQNQQPANPNQSNQQATVQTADAPDAGICYVDGQPCTCGQVKPCPKEAQQQNAQPQQQQASPLQAQAAAQANQSNQPQQAQMATPPSDQAATQAANNQAQSAPATGQDSPQPAQTNVGAPAGVTGEPAADQGGGQQTPQQPSPQTTPAGSQPGSEQGQVVDPPQGQQNPSLGARDPDELQQRDPNQDHDMAARQRAMAASDDDANMAPDAGEMSEDDNTGQTRDEHQDDTRFNEDASEDEEDMDPVDQVKAGNPYPAAKSRTGGTSGGTQSTSAGGNTTGASEDLRPTNPVYGGTSDPNT
jgi:hypothetical protein